MKDLISKRIKRYLMLYRYIALVFVFFLTCLLESSIPEGVPECVILITSYNNEKWAKENLKSVCYQKSSVPYHIIYINDCSTDKTGEVVDAYIKKHNLESLVTVVHNKQRVGAMDNIYNAIHTMIPDHKVVLMCDGDDKYFHDEVLLRIENEYRDPNIWITYGTTLSFPQGNIYAKKVPERIFKAKSIRQYPYGTTMLRTFRAALFKKIRREDLMYEGKFVDVASDVAYMLPMMEMATPKDENSINHSKYITKILYLYRENNPLSDFRINTEKQQFIAETYLRSLRPYGPLDCL